jgi:two-component system sensor histidine kinase PilS (NtrC family)
MSYQSEPVASHDPATTDLAWRILGLTNLYRLLTVLVLVAIYVATRPVAAFGTAAPQLLRVALITYCLLAVLLALAGRRHWPGRRSLVLTHTLVDAIAISVLTYASGGIGSTLGVLLVIPVGSMALLAVGREGLVIAASWGR